MNMYSPSTARCCYRDDEQGIANARLIASAPILLDTLEAIRARIKGEFDNPLLIEKGPLSADANADILLMIHDAIKEATDIQ